MSKIDWFIGFTSENFKKITAKIFKKRFDETVCGIGNDREVAYAFLNLLSFPFFSLVSWS